MIVHCKKFKGPIYGACQSSECPHFYDHDLNVSCTSDCAGVEGNHCYTTSELRKLKLEEIENYKTD